MMTGLLVDTNVISEVLRALPNAQVVAWSQGVQKDQLFLSVVSFGEIRKGLTIMPAGTRRNQLEQAFNELIPNWFASRILPMTQSIANRWGALEGQRQLTGRPFHVPDAQIAATALEHDLTLVTRNVKDFEGIGAAILNPWDPS
jgi:predicted nucleic acid-binding protein